MFKKSYIIACLRNYIRLFKHVYKTLHDGMFKKTNTAMFKETYTGMRTQAGGGMLNFFTSLLKTDPSSSLFLPSGFGG